MADLSDIRQEDGTLPAYAWPGGYPIIYFANDGATICHKCANLPDFREDGDPDGFRLDGYSAHMEGPPEMCAHCNEEIPSAYSEKCETCGGLGSIYGIGNREFECDECEGSGWK